MASYPGNLGISTDVYNITEDWATGPSNVLPRASVNEPLALDPDNIQMGLWTFVDAFPDYVTETNYDGHDGSLRDGTTDWFEHFHVIPRRFDFGNVLTAQQTPIVVHSAFRDDDHTWTALINNAGAGVTLVGQPSLPVIIGPQEGVEMTLTVDTIGAPNVDTTLDFVFDVGTTEVPITLQRVVLFPMQPESGYVEMLEFLTEILEKDDGSEQRISLRKNPRQLFEWKVITEDGRKRSRLENILFDWQRRIFGIPVWHESTKSTSALTAGDTVINVGETAYRDFREGGLVLIYSSDVLSDVGTIAVGGIGATTITLESGILGSHAAGIRVMPLRTGFIRGTTTGRRYPSGAQELTITFQVDDNDANLASTSGWTMLNSKVVLDDANAISGALSETFDQQVTIIDNQTGLVFQSSGWARHKRISGKTFWTNSLQGLWKIRQLLHALRGRQISFYLPTFADDIQVVDPLVSGSASMNIENIGYTQFVRERQPKNIIRFTFTDGTTPLIRTISSSVESSSDVEGLTLTETFPDNYSLAQIDKVMFVEEVRFDSDRIRIQHTPGNRTVRVSSNVKTVFE